jgi:AraC-like DNA-binding protein
MELGPIRLGWMSCLLLAFGLQALVHAAMLTQGPFNRRANLWLAALLVVLAGMLTPYVIGYAGAYDAWPWLSFAPFAVPLATGPLILAYLTALTGGRFNRWHLAPAAVQFAYQNTCFLLPMDLKSAWAGSVDEQWIDPALSIAALASLIAYSLLGLKLLARYRAWLAANRSDDGLFAAGAMRNVLAALAAVAALRLLFEIAERLLGPFNYFDVYPYYLALSAFAAFLGLEGWRNAGRAFPALSTQTSPPASRTRDWRAQGEAWLARTRDAGWAAEPGLTLPDLAGRLGTNTSHLSRAFNEGLGRNFSEAINGLRAEMVAAALRAGAKADLLTLAFDAGFSSKASFNRAFRQRYGMAPSAWRVSDHESSADSGS